MGSLLRFSVLTGKRTDYEKKAIKKVYLQPG